MNLAHKSSPINAVPRDSGRFFWMQGSSFVAAGATTIYGAMFDEVDEGTALFKLAPLPNVTPTSGPISEQLPISDGARCRWKRTAIRLVFDPFGEGWPASPAPCQRFRFKLSGSRLKLI